MTRFARSRWCTHFTSLPLRRPLAIRQGVRLRCNHIGIRNWWQNRHRIQKTLESPFHGPCFCDWEIASGTRLRMENVSKTSIGMVPRRRGAPPAPRELQHPQGHAGLSLKPKPCGILQRAASWHVPYGCDDQVEQDHRHHPDQDAGQHRLVAPSPRAINAPWLLRVVVHFANFAHISSALIRIGICTSLLNRRRLNCSLNCIRLPIHLLYPSTF